MFDFELYQAVVSDDTSLVVEILKNNRSSHSAAMAALWAAYESNSQTLSAILRHFSAIDTFSEDEKFHCMEAAMTSDKKPVDVLKLLVDFGFDPRVKDDIGRNLLFASKSVPYEVFEFLLESGVDPNAKLTSGETPLMEAAKLGRTDLAKLLVQYGADINGQDVKGNTALLYAIRRGHSDTAINLIYLGADIFHESDSCLTPLRVALRIKNTRLLQEMFNHGAQLTETARDNMTALEWLESRSLQDVLDWLTTFNLCDPPPLSRKNSMQP